MKFGDLQKGDAVFLDANVLVYHFTNHPGYGAACTALVERIELKELQGFTSTHCLADVAHRIMTIEAMGRFTWPMSGLAARLKKHHASIPQLSLYQTATAKVGQLGIQVLPVSESLVLAATQLSQQFELLTGDALILAVMRQHGLTNLVSEDADFDRVPGLIRFTSVWCCRYRHVFSRLHILARSSFSVGAEPALRLMAHLRVGDDDATTKVFHCFTHRLVALPRLHIDSRVRQKVDPEDVLQSVYKSFFLRHAQGQLCLSAYRRHDGDCLGFTCYLV